jgi:integrase
VATIRRRLASISQVHQEAGLDSPTEDRLVRRTMVGISRAHGTAPTRKVAIRTRHLQLMVRQIPSSPVGVRDRALLLVGFAGAFRRAELVAIDRAHLSFDPDGVKVFLATSKTDQEGAGQTIGIPYGTHPETCPVLALRAWLDLLPADGGPVFRRFDRWGHIRRTRLTAEWVAEVVKHYVEPIGLDPEQFAGHSLRAGLATSAAAGGAAEWDIMRQTRHKSAEMVRRYMRDAEVLSSANAARFTGL